MIPTGALQAAAKDQTPLSPWGWVWLLALTFTAIMVVWAACYFGKDLARWRLAWLDGRKHKR